MAEGTRMEQAQDVQPGTYLFEVRPGPRGGTLTLADGREIRIGKEGGSERIRIREPQRVVISYLTNGRPPAGIALKRIH